jgi:hypothetical protein
LVASHDVDASEELAVSCDRLLHRIGHDEESIATEWIGALVDAANQVIAGRSRYSHPRTTDEDTARSSSDS